MGNYPVLKPVEVIAILNKLGFVEVRQRGAHKQFRHPDGRPQKTGMTRCFGDCANEVGRYSSLCRVYDRFQGRCLGHQGFADATYCIRRSWIQGLYFVLTLLYLRPSDKIPL